MEFARVVSSIAFVNGEVFLICVVKHRCEGMCPGKAPIEVCVSWVMSALYFLPVKWWQ